MQRGRNFFNLDSRRVLHLKHLQCLSAKHISNQDLGAILKRAAASSFVLHSIAVATVAIHTKEWPSIRKGELFRVGTCMRNGACHLTQIRGRRRDAGLLLGDFLVRESKGRHALTLVRQGVCAPIRMHHIWHPLGGGRGTCCCPPLKKDEDFLSYAAMW